MQIDMAISTDLPGVSITITINDQALPEYILPDLDQVARTTDRLVEAQSNKVFEIQMHADPTTTFHGSQLAFKILVDGRYIETPLIPQVLSQIPGGCTEKSEGMHVSPGQVRKYHFMDVVAVAENTTSLSSRSNSMRRAISRASSSMDDSMPTGLPTPPTSIGAEPALFGRTLPQPRMSERMLTPTMSSDPDGNPPPGPPPRVFSYSERELAELGTIKVVVSHVNATEPVGFTPSSTFSGGRPVAETGKGKRLSLTHYRAKEAIEAFLALSKSDEDVTIKKEEGEGVQVKQEPGLSKPDESARVKEEADGAVVKREPDSLEAVPEETSSKQEAGTAEAEGDEADDQVKKRKPSQDLQATPKSARLEAENATHENKR
ncbi:hypothetical protein HII31_01195 [Pseudocercospora fuligena]|uniref:DUF7918 domain-containing protein n=1 Tax=Pseudocercospora fuligena TaxID=685502 RepID=A0A8H6RT01_9PEZI|nr:hypothetical protein HII31_01195 [Pseudocercospora fuligena]